MITTNAKTLTGSPLKEDGKTLHLVRPVAPAKLPHKDGGYLILMGFDKPESCGIKEIHHHHYKKPKAHCGSCGSCGKIHDSETSCDTCCSKPTPCPCDKCTTEKPKPLAKVMTRFEVVKYDKYECDSDDIQLSLSERGLEGTGAQEWCAGTMVYQSFTGADYQHLLASIETIKACCEHNKKEITALDKRLTQVESCAFVITGMTLSDIIVKDENCADIEEQKHIGMRKLCITRRKCGVECVAEDSKPVDLELEPICEYIDADTVIPNTNDFLKAREATASECTEGCETKTIYDKVDVNGDIVETEFLVTYKYKQLQFEQGTGKYANCVKITDCNGKEWWFFSCLECDGPPLTCGTLEQCETFTALVERVNALENPDTEGSTCDCDAILTRLAAAETRLAALEGSTGGGN